MLDIRYCADRAQSAQIANAVADSFIAEELNANSRTISLTGSWLTQRSDELRKQMDAAEQAVLTFKKENDIAGDSGRSLADQQLDESNANVAKARQNAADVKSRMLQIKNIIDSVSKGKDSEPEVDDQFSNPVLTKLRQDYSDLSNSRKISTCETR